MAPNSSNPALEVGAGIEIPGYEVLKPIGHGSYGTVYLGRSRHDRQWCAIKVCRRTEQNRRDLERELRGLQQYEPVARSLEGFLRVLELGEGSDGRFFYCVMELADDVSTEQEIDPATYTSHTLASDLRRQGNLELGEVLELGLALSSALGCLHAKGLVHRDVKPANIVFVKGQPKLADLGLVTAKEAAQSMVGTPGYIPSEGPGRPQADIYALGKVLYQALTGMEPTRFPDPPTFLKEHPDRVRFQEINDVLLKACDEIPSRRHDSAEEMHEELELVRGGSSVRRLREAREQRARWLRWSAVAAVVAVIGSALGWFFHQVSTHEKVERERQRSAAVSRSARFTAEGDLAGALKDQAALVQQADGTPDETMERLRFGATLAQMPKLSLIFALGGPVMFADFTVDGKGIFVAGRRGSLELRRASDGERLQTFPSAPALITAAVSMNGEWYATAGSGPDFAVKVGRVRTRQFVWSLPHTAMVMCAAFHPVEPILITGSEEGGLRWWSLTNGALVRHVEGHSQAVGTVVLSHDGQLVASGGNDNKVKFWNPQGVPQGDSLSHPSWVKHVAFSPDEKRLLVSCADKKAYVWEVGTRRQVLTPMMHGRAPGSGGFSPWGHWFVTGGWDGFVRFWNARTGAREESLMIRHRYPIRFTEVSRDGQRILTGCADGSVRVWDLAGRLIPEQLNVTTISHGRGQGLVTTADGFGLMDFQEPRHPVHRLPTAPGQRVVSANERGNIIVVATPLTNGPGYLIQLADRTSGRTVGPGVRQEHRPLKVIFDPSDEIAALIGASNVVILSAQGVELWREERAGAVNDLVYSPDGRLVAAGMETNALVWRVADGRVIGGPWAHSKQVRRVRFNQDSTLLLACTYDKTLEGALAQAWDVRTGRPASPPLWHQDGVIDGTWLSDSRVVTTSEDGTARVWDRLTGEIVSEEMAHRDEVWTVEVLNEAVLLTASLDGATRLWEARTGLPLGPAVQFLHPIRSARRVEGTSRVVAITDGGSWLQTIPTCSLSTRELARVASLLSGELATGRSPEEFATGQEREWHKLRQEYPALFETSEDEIVNWCRLEAELCHRAGAEEAAIALTDRLLSLRDGDTMAVSRRKSFLKALDSARKAGERVGP